MRVIEVSATVTSDGKILFEASAPAGIAPGEHRILVVMDDTKVEAAHQSTFEFPVDRFGSWPQDLSLRREDLYAGSNGH